MSIVPPLVDDEGPGPPLTASGCDVPRRHAAPDTEAGTKRDHTTHCPIQKLVMQYIWLTSCHIRTTTCLVARVRPGPGSSRQAFQDRRG